MAGARTRLMVYELYESAAMASNKPSPMGEDGEAPDLRPIISCAIDDVAMAALRERADDAITCELCNEQIDGNPTASGLMMWSRGGELHFDEPPLCPSCANRISVNAWTRWTEQGELD